LILRRRLLLLSPLHPIFLHYFLGPQKLYTVTSAKG
jgi:hypothetical protein